MRVVGVRKTYVEVNADTDLDGRQRPRYITWRDGRRLEVDKVRAVVPAASLKAGGAGIRYTVDISGKCAYLFLEEARMDDPTIIAKWFVEEKVWAD